MKCVICEGGVSRKTIGCLVGQIDRRGQTIAYLQRQIHDIRARQEKEKAENQRMINESIDCSWAEEITFLERVQMMYSRITKLEDDNEKLRGEAVRDQVIREALLTKITALEEENEMRRRQANGDRKEIETMNKLVESVTSDLNRTMKENTKT